MKLDRTLEPAPRAPWAPPVIQVRKFKNIIIEAACNLRCTYCEVKKAKVDQAVVIESLERILDTFDPGTTFIRIEADGEISGYPRILDYAQRKVRDEGYSIEILTNGTRLPQCLRPDLKWVFSVDGHTARMNAKRGLTQEQTDTILRYGAELGADLQCVVHDQTVDEMNGFIDELTRLDFRGQLFLLPLLAFKGRPMTVLLEYDQLHRADFLPSREYFARWKYIYENGHRGPYVCNQISNGQNYVVEVNGDVLMVKCDSYGAPKRFHYPLGPEREFMDFPCGTCLSNQEFHNARPRMRVRESLPVISS